ncbi:MAG: polysaccharide deacetylase family protein, partial [Saprospiraceae bacterium]|nr:polysaccharide deacetylase family protein [Saprospiraceae bacterium]
MASSSAFTRVKRQIIAPALVTSRIERLAYLTKKPGVVALCFHGVTNVPCPALRQRHMPVGHFRSLLRYLKQHFDVVPSGEIGNIPSRSKRWRVSLTFDDGYLNNVSTALPVLEEMGLPATFFIPTLGFADNGIVWSNVVDLIAHTVAQGTEFQAGEMRVLRTRQGLVDADTGEDLHAMMKRMAPAERDAAVQCLQQTDLFTSVLDRADPSCWQHMRREQLVTVAAHPLITIGSHGHNHYNL